LAAKLRRADIDASAGAAGEIARIVAQIRARWPNVGILLRADSGFAREALMAWCEANRVDYLFGLARNPRLAAMIENELAVARSAAEASRKPARRFKEFAWSTLDSWSRERRVVAKAEWTQGEANPRFVVTSLKPEAAGARWLYEKLYCARGDMENRIKECQLDLFADRTSTATMRANQLRLWLAFDGYFLYYPQHPMTSNLRAIAISVAARAAMEVIRGRERDCDQEVRCEAERRGTRAARSHGSGGEGFGAIAEEGSHPAEGRRFRGG
jgi:hypothetical protein